MCLATPMRIRRIKDNKAVVESEKHTHTVDISLIKNPEVGDYILAHADIAINKISRDEAEKILQVISNNKHEK